MERRLFCEIIGSVGYAYLDNYGRELTAASLDSLQILSIAFEFAEYSLQHQLPNFAEVCCLSDFLISSSM